MAKKKSGQNAASSATESTSSELGSNSALPGGISDPWRDNPALVRDFLERRPQYLRLCDEITYILECKLSDLGVEVAGITSRAKTLDSFVEKINRKSYSEPLQEIMDFAGVRVVALYVNDLKEIEKVIADEFEIVERVDKLSDRNVDQFGYGAVHFVVTLGSRSTGARYDRLKVLRCEIQTRTVLQDAWAIIQHHLVYKKESDVPTVLQRKINGLAGLFEIADDQFQTIKEQRSQYIREVEELTITPNAFLELPINADTLNAYLKWKFPTRLLEGWPKQARSLFPLMNRKKYKSLNVLDKLMNESADERAESLKGSPFADGDNGTPAAIELLWTLINKDEEFAARLKPNEEKQRNEIEASTPKEET